MFASITTESFEWILNEYPLNCSIDQPFQLSSTDLRDEIFRLVSLAEQKIVIVDG